MMDSCLNLLAGIRNGTQEFRGVTNETLASTGWWWDGPIALLNKGVPRESITAITYKGCLELCGGTELNRPKAALIIATTWIFPLSILFCLPYDSLRRNKLWGTLGAVSNWLGSPPTAIASTIFNFDQIRKCHRLARHGIPEDTYYVLSCFNQFALPMQGNDRDSTLNNKFATALIYGLFRPLRDGPENHSPGNLDIELTKQLLAVLASNLRLLRRRGIVPMVLSLGTFLAAFVFSIYLAFGATGEGVDVTGLTLGLLYGWLPMLVICTIIDRNPVSSDRVRELMSRWLFNVEAVRLWRLQGAGPMSQIEWWTATTPPHFKIGDFVGQGRQMHYCGLAHAITICGANPEEIDDTNGLKGYDELAYRVVLKLDGRRPWLWFSSAFRAMFLVWAQLFMSFAIAFSSPTVGIGCWSGSIVFFGVLASFSWFVSLFKKSCGPRLRVLCHIVNVTAILFLVFLTGLVFVRSNYDVMVPCSLATAVGLSVSLGFFVFEMVWWMKCKHLWRTTECGRPIPLDTRGVRVDMSWLQ
ncbi:hypothetical protein B0T16DRAFT_437739 [Cercophora newfieldiana]|uniref:Transmembrane protein n=1 Tax=Cercophora newfieldiana TaxID=92897 RepID=A0AA39Y031_9PEZI|nr:hypothetical protein B0T16DRAFT_437739 [Cercophora newfieldiana]